MNIIFFEILNVYRHEEDWFSSIFHGMTLHIFAQQRFLSNFEAANAHCSDYGLKHFLANFFRVIHQ
jgi:hypothetical protein